MSAGLITDNHECIVYDDDNSALPLCSCWSGMTKGMVARWVLRTPRVGGGRGGGGWLYLVIGAVGKEKLFHSLTCRQHGMPVS